MRIVQGVVVTLVASLAAMAPLRAATPEAEQAFLDAYKAAYASQDADAFAALLQVDGAIEDAVDFYLMQMTSELGGELSLDLQDLTEEEAAGVDDVLPGPDGLDFVLSPLPYKKLVITIVTRDGDQEVTSSGSVFVAEQGDRVVISMPTRAP